MRSSSRKTRSRTATRSRSKKPPSAGKHIRKAGLDFTLGSVLARAGQRLRARDLALLAAGDLPVRVRAPSPARGTCRHRRRTLAARHPAQARRHRRIVRVRIKRDDRELGRRADRSRHSARHGRSGERPARTRQRRRSHRHHGRRFRRRPRPRAHSPSAQRLRARFLEDRDASRQAAHLRTSRATTPFLGLPGNPVSSFVCAILFLKPAIAAMLGETRKSGLRTARIARSLPANDTRQDYLRAGLAFRDGEWWAEPFAVQDFSMQSAFAAADCLIVRAPHATGRRRWRRSRRASARRRLNPTS